MKMLKNILLENLTNIILMGSPETEPQKKEFIESSKKQIIQKSKSTLENNLETISSDIILQLHYNSFFYKNIKLMKSKIIEFVKKKYLPNSLKLLIIYNIDNLNTDFQYFLKSILINYEVICIVTTYQLDNILPSIISRFTTYRLRTIYNTNNQFTKIKEYDILHWVYNKILDILVSNKKKEAIRAFNDEYLNILKYLSHNEYYELSFYVLLCYIQTNLKNYLSEKVIQKIEARIGEITICC